LSVARSPRTDDPEVARAWVERLEVAGFDGVIAKRLGLAYQPGSRDAVKKVKAHKRHAARHITPSVHAKATHHVAAARHIKKGKRVHTVRQASVRTPANASLRTGTN